MVVLLSEGDEINFEHLFSKNYIMIGHSFQWAGRKLLPFLYRNTLKVTLKIESSGI